jgi:CDP-glycerol glycerophosphotransferase (TagB/SpsB family)
MRVQRKQKSTIKLLHQLLHVRKSGNSLSFSGIHIIKKHSTQAPNPQYFQIADYNYPFKSLLVINLAKVYRLTLYTVSINLNELQLSHINNVIYISGSNEKYEIAKRALSYNLLGKRDFLMLRSKIHNLANNKVIYLKQGNGNSLILTQREKNTSDAKLHRFKISIAFVLSKLLFFYQPIVLFEKQSETYEESASILYEKLIDKGYKNTFFILGKEKRDLYSIGKKYLKNIIERHSFKHYFLYFSAKTFLATETPFHGTELRTVSRFIHWHIRYSKRFKYVFLQHGIMLMVSLDSKTRSAFRKGGWLSQHGKIVVASKEEANHFIDLGGFEKEDLFITGIPKFDLSTKDKNADKIIIMPTWKPWEEAKAKSTPEKTDYYNMLKEMFNSVPLELRDKVKILPHPLISKHLKKTNLKKYIPEKFSYHLELKKTALLITDYSSIAFDAFYRGAPTIFWWKELEKNMNIYQAHLMLNKDNVFGDICYNSQELSKSIKDNYQSTQKQIYIERFNKLVDFPEGKNTERLIEKLKEENYI